jgi:hypothetical protein
MGGDEIHFAGGLDQRAETVYVRVKTARGAVLELAGREISLDRPQGDIGLFVPDAGYPFGEIPDWLARQRLKAPEWAPNWARKVRSRPQ